MPKAHLYLFSDASPSDWLVERQEEVWRTVVNFVFQSDPDLQEQVESGKTYSEVLSQDLLYASFINDLQSHLPSGQLRKWNTRGGYKFRLCYALGMIQPRHKPIISACSFQEKTLRASKVALLESYNRHIGNVKGGGTGLDKFKETKRRLQRKPSPTLSHGYHEIQSLENQKLIQLFMAWFIADQYTFYRKNFVTRGRLDFDSLGVTIVSDKLSGDDDSRRKHQQNLRNLIDAQGKAAEIVLARSTLDAPHSGDLLVNNLTGWMNAAISDPTGEFAQKAKAMAYSGVWARWSIFLESVDKPCYVPALSRLMGHNAP